MSEGKKSDDGKGVPPAAEGTTTEPQAKDPRLIPGGSFRNAAIPIGMNGVDPEDLPSYGRSHVDDKDTPAHDSERPARPPEPGGSTPAANATAGVTPPKSP